MPSIQLSESIAAPLDRVYAVATDIPNTPSIFPQIVRVEMLEKGERPQVGTRWLETRKAGSRSVTVELVFTNINPPGAFTIDCTTMGARYSTRFEFKADTPGASTSTPSGPGSPSTLATLVTTITPTRWWGGLAALLLKGPMAQGLRADLAALKRACEAKA